MLLGARREHPYPLELELEEVVSHLMWRLGTKFRPSKRAANAFSC